MSARWMRRHRGADRHRADGNQAGYTLLELLVVLAISALLLVPLSAWVSLALRQQPVTRDGLLRTASTGLLGAYLPRDIAVAGAGAIDGTTDVDAEDCVGGRGAGGRIVLVLISGSPATKTVYTEAPTEVGGSIQGVWRRQCDAATGTLASATLVFRGVEDGSTRATCSSEAGDTPCRQVEFRTTPLTGRGDVVLRGTRRTDSESLFVDATGNRLPVAKIAVLSQTVGEPFTVSLTSSGSSDPDGTVASREWVLPGAGQITAGGSGGTDITVRFPSAGDHYIQLTVTDDRGATSTTYRRISSSSRSPVAVATASPGDGVAGETTFTFSGSESYDPDGAIASYRWVVDGAGVARTETTPNFSMVMPPTTTGMVSASLTVTDAQGLTSATVASVQVYLPGQDPGATTTTVPGAPTAVFTATKGSGNSWAFDASGSAGAVTYAWDFGLLAGTGAGVTATKTYAGAGDYEVRLTVTDATGASATSSQTINVAGQPDAPDPRQAGSRIEWPGVPGAARYLVDFEFAAAGCLEELNGQVVAAAAAPSIAIPASLCPGGTINARVGTEANGVIVWSGRFGVTG